MEFMDLIEIPRVDNVKYCKILIDDQKQLVNQFIDGSLCLTSHHLIFSPKEKANKEIWIQHNLIDQLELKNKETKYQIILKCKDFQQYLVDFPSSYACLSIHRSLEALSNITSENMKLPFFYQLSFKPDTDGWSFYSIEKVFESFFGSCSDSSCEWRISDVNKDYNVNTLKLIFVGSYS